MSLLKPKIAISILDNSNTMIVTDITGLYDATYNPNAWKITGSSNPTPTRVDFAVSNATVTLKIKFPNTNQFTTFNVKSQVSGTATPNAYYPSYTFVITQLGTSDFSLSGQFPDGKYTYEYILYDGTTTYKTQGYFYSTCLTQCCVNKKINDYLDAIKCGKCGCQDLKNYYLMRAYLETGVQSAVQEWNFALADELLEKARKYCNFKNCGC